LNHKHIEPSEQVLTITHKENEN